MAGGFPRQLDDTLFDFLVGLVETDSMVNG